MKKKIFYAALSFVVLAIIFVISATNKSQHGALVAVIGRYKIYEGDIQKRIATFSTDAGIAKLDELPNDLIEAVALEVAVNRTIDKETKKLNYANKKEIKKIVNDYEKEIVREKYLNDVVYSKVTDEDVKIAYEKMQKSLDGQEERRIKHILMENEEDIERVRRSIGRGENFEKVATQKSIDKGSATNGGDIGYVLKSELDPEFANIAFILKVGEVSKVVKSAYGWHLIKVVDIRPATYLPFEEVKDNIKISLQQEAVRDYIKKITKDMKVELKYEKKELPIQENKE